MTKKLLVSDYDGTLIRSDGTISPQQIKTINDFIENGNIFAVITGRMTSSILPLVRKLGLKGLVAAFNGGEVTEIETGKHIYTNYIDTHLAVEVFKAAEKSGAYIQGYYEEDCYCQTRTKYTNYYEQITNVKINVLNCPLSEHFSNNSLPTKKILVMDNPEMCDKAMPYLEGFKDRLQVIRSNPNQIEITTLNSTKATAMEYLAKFYGIEKANTFSCGDGGNDASMILSAGVGFAVANAVPILKSIAPKVLAYTNEQDAVKHIIEEEI
jgi:Cof subfamily protein (haloacid dehalogenase superfamily)